MKIITVKMRLSVALLVTVFSSIKNSSPNLDSDEEVFDQCTIHASEYDQTTLDAAEGKYNSKACSAVVTCHPNQMSISLSKAVLLGVNREELGLMDSNCTATDNGTHFVLTTTLIGCGTSSRHTNKSVVYSNMVRLVLSPTAIITRAPNVKISFSCHYSKYAAVSTGAITNGREQDISETADQEFAHDGEFCWRNSFLFVPRHPTCPAKSTTYTGEQKRGQRRVDE